MVCIYCARQTHITNSRHQKRLNGVWRRRECLSCKAVFTTLERVDTTEALRIRSNGNLEPFSRDKLLLSVYDSLRHRKTSLEDATALTATILGKLYPFVSHATLDRSDIVTVVSDTLRNFDTVAATHYQAFHPDRQAT